MHPRWLAGFLLSTVALTPPPWEMWSPGRPDQRSATTWCSAVGGSKIIFNGIFWGDTPTNCTKDKKKNTLVIFPIAMGNPPFSTMNYINPTNGGFAMAMLDYRRNIGSGGFKECFLFFEFSGIFVPKNVGETRCQSDLCNSNWLELLRYLDLQHLTTREVRCFQTHRWKNRVEVGTWTRESHGIPALNERKSTVFLEETIILQSSFWKRRDGERKTVFSEVNTQKLWNQLLAWSVRL